MGRPRKTQPIEAVTPAVNPFAANPFAQPQTQPQPTPTPSVVTTTLPPEKSKKPSKSTNQEPHSGLLTALKFVKFAQGDIGPVYMRHCVLYDGTVYAHDGTLSAGMRVPEHAQVQLAPHTDKLIAALERCEGQLALVQVAAGLQIRSGKLKAVVPCLDLSTVPPIFPDPPCAPISDTLRDALRACAPLAADGAQFAALAGIRLSTNTAVATNRHVVIEYWHGHSMPTILLPKVAAKELLRISKPLVSFGVSANLSSITFYFDDGSWLKSQLFDGKNFPSNYDKVMDVPTPYIMDVPPGFFEGCKMLAPFTNDNDTIYMLNGFLSTNQDGSGTTVEFPGMPYGTAFDGKYLKLIEPLAKRIDFGVKPGGGQSNLMFYGDNVRGGMAPVRVGEVAAPPPNQIEEFAQAVATFPAGAVQLPPVAFDEMSDDIPF